MKVCKNEFLRKEGILAVDPGYSFYSGAGWSFFEDGKLKYCGAVKPFAPGCTSLKSIFEVLQKISKTWEDIKGFSIKPSILCLESPVTYQHYAKNINTNVLGEIHYLNGMLTERFQPEEVLRVTPSQWKGNKPKEEHHIEIIKSLDSYSKKKLEDCLSTIPKKQHHNVIDAVGLGLYAIPFEEKMYENKLSRLSLANKNS